MVFPVTTTENKRYAIFMQNQALVVDKETETLPSLAVLLKAGFDVKFVTGTKKDPTFGGYLVILDRQKICMTFGDNLWRLPMWSDPVRYSTGARPEIGTGISEASKRVPIFPFATQGGKQASPYFRQRNWAQACEAQIRFPAGGLKFDSIK